MPLDCINPDDLPIPEIYTQVVVATGSKLVFVSGQQPEDRNGKLVGHGDLPLRRACRDDVPRLPDRGRCDRGHRPHHRKRRQDAGDTSLTPDLL